MLKRVWSNKGGSTIIMLSLAFLAFALCMAGAIDISRRLAVKSEVNSYGRVWTGAVLSEYDRHLVEDYRILAYRGLDCEIASKLKDYADFSMKGLMNAKISGIDTNLYGMELTDPDNFRMSLKNSELSSSISALLGSGVRHSRPASEDELFGRRVIRNKAVLNSLPSRGDSSSVNLDGFEDTAEDKSEVTDFLGSLGDSALEMAYIYQYFGSHNECTGDKPTLLRNEWEYIICGKADDARNYKSVKNKLFVMRNALNLTYLYKDSGKRELIITVSELITPGPAAAATQAIIAEAWAAIEAAEDIRTLDKNGRVPIMKSDDTWKTDIRSVLKSDDVTGKLDDEAKELLNENIDQISDDQKGKGESISNGLRYEEYLLILLSMTGSNTRILRIMDLISINMRYRYYEDFNMSEYHTGVGFSIKANGRQYDFEENYE